MFACLTKIRCYSFINLMQNIANINILLVKIMSIYPQWRGKYEIYLSKARWPQTNDNNPYDCNWCLCIITGILRKSSLTPPSLSAVHSPVQHRGKLKNFSLNLQLRHIQLVGYGTNYQLVISSLRELGFFKTYLGSLKCLQFCRYQ